VKRIKLEIAPGVETEFVDRDRALAQVVEWAERGTRFPVVIFGPEGCGKTAFLRQSMVMLRELGYDVFYLHPLDRVFAAEVDDPDVKTLFLDLVRKTLEDERWGRMALAVFDLTREILKKRRRKIAVIADDVFQAIGLDKAAAYVKGLLNMIEHPVYSYEKIVVLVATSEGVTREEIGRHFWAELTPMWNMSREGFQQLYGRLPGPRPPFEEVWRWTGGNPRMLGRLYESGWDVVGVALRVAEEKRLTAEFVSRWRSWLELAVEDPDVVGKVEFPHELRQELVWRNLIIYIYRRGPALWVDQPPPERDSELGIGRNVAWQTPIHREAVRRALREVLPSCLNCVTKTFKRRSAVVVVVELVERPLPRPSNRGVCGG
jgi:Archaeal ATPase.